ncbi:hypothetical protein ABEB36_008104 [Hypothenemus hampei]|uniref:GDNF/GAS1 domain-containing protein n=2 Tax=Hypothenemus hampei TaxID=57062 RepID=A0ABD1EKR8_HYPHA
MGMFCVRTILILLLASGCALCSEHPGRECCDLTTTESTSTTGSLHTTSTQRPSGSNTKATVAILNCLTARQLCFNDSSCSAIVEIIPRVCGPEVVACSTVTVTKCQAALRTLQAFPFFKPTCLCREPHMDRECNSFRDFLFDHPCVFVKEKEKDPYPVDALPTCTHAHQVCQQEPKCIKLYEDFKTHCKVRDNKCRMEDRESCFESWSGLRRSPMFGCICPNNHMKRRCDRMFSMVNHNPCVDNSIDPEKEKLVFQSTCHSAMDSCNNNYHCRMLLAPILHHCDISRCNRNSCMEALQTFYGKSDFPWNVEIAFCLCKKTDNRHDACLIAQEKLHPACAQRSEETPQPNCLHLVETCKESKACRLKLEYYEQSCAVDSVTKKCAGSPNECRKSILAILGTDLRTTCACKGTDMSELYQCLGWQRLLWVNPCVVEAQKHFHMKKAIEQSRLSTHTPVQITTTTTTTNAPSTKIITTTTTVMPREKMDFSDVKLVTEAPLKLSTEFLPPPQRFVPTIISTSTISTTTERKTTTKRTRPTTSTTPVPSRSCVVQRAPYPDQFIREGTYKRIYHEDDFECSDVCECEIGKELSCRTICIDRMPCRSEFAFYNHAAPAYQAFRGRCLCYSGRFVCIKPAPTDNALPHGVFLFLGYSEVDERELNKNHTTHLVVVQDVVRVLQAFIKDEAEKENGTSCVLEFFNSTRENVIIVGKLSDEIDVNQMTPVEILEREKEECAKLMEIIVDRINNKHVDFLSHVLLSIFKIAEIEIVPIQTSSASSLQSSSVKQIIVCFIILSTVKFIQNYLTIS